MQTRMSGGPPGDWKMDEKPDGWLGADGWGIVAGGGGGSEGLGLVVLLLERLVVDIAGAGAGVGELRRRIWCWLRRGVRIEIQTEGGRWSAGYPDSTRGGEIEGKAEVRELSPWAW